MNEIDTDHLWLHQTPPPRKRLHRLSLLLCLLLFAGVFWIYATGPTGSKAQSATLTVVTTTTPPSPTTAKSPVTAANQVSGTTLRTALRIEPGRLLTPTRNLVYNAAPAGTNAHNQSADNGWIDVTIHRGDTLSLAFAQHGLSYTDSLAIAHLPEHGEYFTYHLRPGDTLKVKANDQGHVLKLKYPLDSIRTLKVRATQDGYDARIIRADLTRRVAYATGVIYDSFYQDAMQAGLSGRQVMQITDIFKWTVNFGYDIHPGDRFTVVYSELYKDGRKITTGHILAVSLQTDSGRLRALRFVGGDGEPGYYRPDGTSLKRALLRSPVDYTRISSPFSMSRQHPILHTVRAHEGIDYAAPMGTPIHAAGGGRIVSIGRNGGYGNMIAIDHGRGIVTRYGHMSRFASGLHVGSHVEQGEVIGYVGSTGLSTGPHLHFEIRIDGVPRNPQTVDLPGAPPLPDKYMDEFKAHIEPLIAQLEAVSSTLLAKNQRQGIAQ